MGNKGSKYTDTNNNNESPAYGNVVESPKLKEIIIHKGYDNGENFHRATFHSQNLNHTQMGHRMGKNCQLTS